MDSNNEVIRKVSDYMSSKGFVFKKINLSDSSPYAILQNGTSLGYRTGKNKWNKQGIVFFCSKDGKDMNCLRNGLGIEPGDNSTDAARPYAMFIPDGKLEDAIDLLKNNQNISPSPSAKKETKVSYKEKYYDEYYEFVKDCLSADGYSSSDGSVRTAVSDTFYLERQIRNVDFLSWFKNAESFEKAKQEIINLLTAARRKSSNLDLDIKYYTRDISYFKRFLIEKGYVNFEDSRYVFIATMDAEKRIDLVQEKNFGRYLVRKRYKTFNESVFHQLKELHINGLPEIVSVEREGDELITVEEYITGKNLEEIHKEKGDFSEQKIYEISIQLCEILKELHNASPKLIHRDVKPSNIIFRKDGSIVLIDFNASRNVNKENNQDTQLFGTQYFGAPEQLTGYDQTDETADIFSFGATMSYLSTGMYFSQMISFGVFHDIWAKCVSYNKKDRFQCIEELEEAIKNAWNSR